MSCSTHVDCVHEHQCQSGRSINYYRRCHTKNGRLGPEADRFLDAIEGAKNCINLIEDIKNETVSDPNKELIRSINNAVEDEIRSIKADLKRAQLAKSQIESTTNVLIETTRLTVKRLAQDDDALLDAARLPDSFFKILAHRAEALPDWCDDATETLYRRLLKRMSEEFVARAQNFDRFNQVALASLLQDFFLTKKQLNSIERKVHENHDINLETNRVVKELAQHSLSSTPSRLIFGSRPDVIARDRFVPRGEQDKLNSVITNPKQRRTVLVGMSGCGKTQLASALAQQCEENNWSLVAWVNAGSTESIKRDLVELATELKIPTSDQPSPDKLIERCRNHLQSAEASDRLIIFDNVKDLDDLADLYRPVTAYALLQQQQITPAGMIRAGTPLRSGCLVETSRSNTSWTSQTPKIATPQMHWLNASATYHLRSHKLLAYASALIFH